MRDDLTWEAKTDEDWKFLLGPEYKRPEPMDAVTVKVAHVDADTNTIWLE